MLTKLAGGTVHKLPADVKQAIQANANALVTWQDITPLARNEWICWMTSGAKAETRTKRIKWGIEKLHKGTRRPCCWAGCIHRERNGT